MALMDIIKTLAPEGADDLLQCLAEYSAESAAEAMTEVRLHDMPVMLHGKHQASQRAEGC